MPDGRGPGTYFLGRYRVVDEIGIGGMASVHLARMDGPGGFQKWVAIKRIHPHLVEDQTFIHMFLDEARIAARISHSNVATVFDLGEHEDTYWIAMEYLHGEPLREVMRRTEELGAPMPPEIACRVIADAAEGLHAAHELLGKNGEKLQLVHRDVTPHNLFVTYDGTTKVVDFGIAKFSSRMSSTRAGTLKGKLAYMSPEQVHGESLDRRTDIFALGVVLWELTTGQRLFRMESDLDTLAKVQECNVPRPSTIVRGYPMDLEKIVMKALAKNRGERFKTAREFSRALQQLLMRRGLFIASDEVSAYMQQIFADRIQKREAHLRWAAEVTQTINLEGMLTRPPEPIIAEGSLGSYNSDVKASTTAKAGVRPAAGSPAEQARLAAETAPTDMRGPSRSAQTLRPPAKQAAALDAPADDDGPTLQASPQARRDMMVAHGLGEELPSLVDEDDDDNDDTIVTTTKVDGQAYGAMAGKLPTPIPAAGKPASIPPSVPRSNARESVAFAAPPRSVPQRAPSAPALPPVVVAPAAGTPMFPPASNRPPPPDDMRSTAHVDALLAEALAEQRNQVTAERPSLGAIDASLRLPPPAPARTNLPTMPRLFAPPTPDMKTDTARALRRSPPVWMVALAAGLTTLITAGIMIAIASALSARSAPPPAAPPSAATSTAAHAPPSASGGPFGSTRAAFSSALAAAPPPASAFPSASAPPPALPAASAAPPASASTPPPPADSAPAPSPAARPPTTPAPAAAPVHRAAAPAPAPHPAPAPAATGDQGQLTIICFPACDAVTDNGQALGPSPIFKRTVPVGEHKLRMTSSNPSATKTVSVIVMAAQTTTVRQPMTP